jgi:hypothetical protein
LTLGSTLRSTLRMPRLWQLGALAGLAVLAVAAVVVLRGRSARTAPQGSLLLAAPADSWLIATLDVAAAAPLLEPLLGDEGVATATRAAGLGLLSEACGFEPLQRVREVLIAAPEGGERGDFGVAFSADLTMDELSTCARKAIEARGGKPGATTRGGFTVIGDDSLAEGLAGDARGGGAGAAPGEVAEGGEGASDAPSRGEGRSEVRLAYRGGGPFLVGRGSWVNAMIDAVEGRGPRAQPAHESLRRSMLGDAAPRALVITALLPKALRDRIRAESAGAAPAGAAAPAPATPAGAAREAFVGVLGVEEAGAVVTTTSSATELEVELRCETDEACVDVKGLLGRVRLALSGNLAVRLFGLGALVDGLTIDDSNPRELVIKTRDSTQELARALRGVASGGFSRPAVPEPTSFPLPVPPPPLLTAPSESAPPSPSPSTR